MNALPIVALPDMPALPANPAPLSATGDFMALFDLSGSEAPPMPVAPDGAAPDAMPPDELLATLIAQPAMRIMLTREGASIEASSAPAINAASVLEPAAIPVISPPSLPAPMHPFPLEMAQRTAGPPQSGGEARELALDEAGLAALARDIALRGAGERVLRFQLHPASLGAIKVEIGGAEGAMQVAFTAETEAARAALSDAQARLVTEARAQGVRLEELRFSLSQDAQGGQQRQHEPRGRSPAGVLSGDPGPSVTEESLTPRKPRFPQDRFA